MLLNVFVIRSVLSISYVTALGIFGVVHIGYLFIIWHPCHARLRHVTSR